MNQQRTVLLADDDVDDFELFCEVLKKVLPATDIRRAENGAELLHQLKHNAQPDFVFVDLNMPIVNGITAVKEIRKEERYNNIPVIIYSTSHYMKDIHTSFQEGANYYVVKPDTRGGLENLLTNLFQKLIGEGVTRPAKGDFVLMEQKLQEL